MHIARFDSETNTLYFYFYGELVAEEADNALLQWVSTSQRTDSLQVQRLFLDLRQITAAGLENSDVARSHFFKRQMCKKLGLSADELSSFIANLQVVCLINPTSLAGRVYLKRLQLMSRHYPAPLTTHDNFETAVQTLGLQVSDVEKIIDSMAVESLTTNND